MEETIFMEYLRRWLNNRLKKGLVLTLMFVTCVCAMCACADLNNIEQNDTVSKEQVSGEYEITKADQTIEPERPKYINLSETSGNYVIQDGGEYVISGESKYTLVIDAQDQMVKLFLDGVKISVSEGAAINVVSASKVIIILMDGTKNVMENSPQKKVTDESSAVIYSVADLTINGTGEMSVYGYNEDGIRTKDILKILGGYIYVKAKQDGLRGSDGIFLLNAEIRVESEGNGIVSTNIGKKGKGAIIIDNEKLSIISGEYGIVCAENLYVKNSDVFLKSVIGDMKVEGELFADEGSCSNK